VGPFVRSISAVRFLALAGGGSGGPGGALRLLGMRASEVVEKKKGTS
jgi:hypothetical protein